MFYKDCYYCNENSIQRCFECSQARIMQEDWIYSLGFYYPRCLKEHETSKWSKAILMAKRQSSILLVFGKILAFYLNGLEHLKPYTLTYVPDFQDGQLFNLPRMQLLATICFSKIEDKKWVSNEKILLQVKSKRKKQRYCSTDKERSENVKGIYAVSGCEKVNGKNIVLLDDVTTSGATLKESKDLLLNAGAREVIGVTLAKTFRNGGA